MLNLISKKLSTALKVIGGVLVAGAFFAFGIFAGHKLLGDKDQKKANQLIRQEMQTRKSRKIVQITDKFCPTLYESKGNCLYNAMEIIKMLKGDDLAVIKENLEVPAYNMRKLQGDLILTKDMIENEILKSKVKAKEHIIEMIVANERVSLGALSTLLDETEELLKEVELQH